jgi:hypothetical protein
LPRLKLHRRCWNRIADVEIASPMLKSHCRCWNRIAGRRWNHAQCKRCFNVSSFLAMPPIGLTSVKRIKGFGGHFVILDQGCQMVCFQTKNPNLGKFWRVLQSKMLVYFMDTWSILRSFVIFYRHLV